MIQEDPDTIQAEDRLLCHPLDARFFSLAECRSPWVIEATTQISVKGQGDQTMCGITRSLQATPEKVMSDRVRVKPELQWRPHVVEDDRNSNDLLRKVTSNEWSQSKKEPM
jgi:hypothetical protein